MTWKRSASHIAMLACALALASLAWVGSAFAVTVHGADSFGASGLTELGEIDALNVDGSAGETVFLTVKAAGRVLAQNLPYTIGAGSDDEADENASWAGIATLDIDGLDLNALDGTYTIEAYADRANSKQLYSGALYGVYADLPDGTTKLIGTRTVNVSELSARAYTPAETLAVDGRTYRLADAADAAAGDAATADAADAATADAPAAGAPATGAPAATADAPATDTGAADTDMTVATESAAATDAADGADAAGALHFPYVEYDEATTVDGVVNYVDASGVPVASTKIAGLAYDEERTVEIPSVVTADNGDMYRTVFFRKSVVAKNPGRTSFSVYCTKMSDADKALSGFYVATIQMVDEDGRIIASDSVNVTGEFAYTAPSTIYKTEADESGNSSVVTYALASDQSPTVRLSAANDGVLNRASTVTIRYTTEQADPATVTVTFNMIDGSKRVEEKGRALGTFRATATDEEPTVEPESEIEVAGTTYRLVGSPSDYAYTLHSGLAASVDAYYVPDGYTPPGATEVTVNYVNFLTGETVESHAYASDPDQNSRITIDTPGAFEAGGVDYVRLDGQGDSIAHNYYSGISSYTVYYRDVRDELTAGTVINTIRVVYVDGTTAVDAGVPTGEDATAAAADGTQALQLNDGRTYNVFDGADNASTLTNESGIDSNTERIEDNETPLASGFDRGGTSSAATSLTSTMSLLVPMGIALGAIVVAGVAVAAIRRRKHEEDEW